MLWILRWEVRVVDGGRSLGTKVRGRIDVVRVGDLGEGIAEDPSVEIVGVVVRMGEVAVVHLKGANIWLVVALRESGVNMMGVGVDTRRYGTCGYRMSSRRRFGSVFEFDFEVLRANIRVFSADFFEGLGFGFVKFLGAAVEEIIVCRAFFNVRSGGCTGVGM